MRWGNASACCSCTAVCTVSGLQRAAAAAGWPADSDQLRVPTRRFHGKGIWGVYPDAILPGVHMVRAAALRLVTSCA